MTANKKFLLSVLLFALIFLLTVGPITWLFARKSLEGPWDMTRKISGFYNEPEGEFSVMFFGSSHVYASVSPLQLWANTGVKSYVFATQLQPMWATYAYIKEALKTQDLQLIVVECNMMGGDQEYYDDGVNFSFMDDIPLSLNKIQLAFASAPEGERAPLLWNFMKYHGRWSELEDQDYYTKRSDLRDPYKGHVLLPDKQVVTPEVIPMAEGESGELLDKNVEYLAKIVALCEARDIDLWLIKSPSNTALEETQALRMEQVGALAAAYGVPFDDFNACYEEIGLTTADFYDQRHLTGSGAVKFTNYLSILLSRRWPNLMAQSGDEEWAADYAAYHALWEDAA